MNQEIKNRKELLQVGVILGDPRLPYAYSIDNKFGEDELEAEKQLRSALAKLEGYRFTYFDNHESLIDDLRSEPPQLALNLCDTGFRNILEQELNVQALLEMLGIPYTGADPRATVLGLDKALIRALARERGILVPNETFVDLTLEPLILPTYYPSMIKPNNTAGSFGVTRDSLVQNKKEAQQYLVYLRDELQLTQALIQDFLTGEEYTVGLIGNPEGGFTFLPPLEVDFSDLDPSLPRILTYGSKADPESPYWESLRFKKADISDSNWGRIVNSCVTLFRRLGYRDYARVDFRCGADGLPRLLEANTNPTWYANGKMALMAGWQGCEYHQLMEMIIEAAAARYGL